MENLEFLKLQRSNRKKLFGNKINNPKVEMNHSLHQIIKHLKTIDRGKTKEKEICQAA